MKLAVRGLITGGALVLLFALMPAVFAEEATDDSTTTTTTDIREGDDPRLELKQRIQALKEERQENKQQRLEANKLRVCEQRKTKITAIMNRAVVRAERQLELFTTIAERVKNFYEEKGRTIANYDELVAAVDAAKADAEANLEVLKGLEPFDCNAEDPKGNVEAFKLALKSINEDLKAYRTSVKNLIVGVKSAQSQTTGGDQDTPEEGEQEGGEQ
jgi:hypothetical protein